MTDKPELAHEECIYCLDERDGCCTADCHPDRDCQTITWLITEQIIYNLRRNRPPGQAPG